MLVKKISFVRPNLLEEIPDIEDYNLDGFVESGLVSFTDSVTNKHRTIVKMSPKKIKKLAKEGFHLFPNK